MESDDIIFNFSSFEEAFSVHKEMFRLLKEQGYLTYADTSKILGHPIPESKKSSYFRYGWNNLFGVTVDYAQTKEGTYWYIKLPDLVDLTRNKLYFKKENKNEESNIK